MGRILVMRPDGLKIQRIGRIASRENKSEILTCVSQPFINDGLLLRKVSPLEAERLQTVPEGYTDCGLSINQRFKCLGNGWTVDVIVHILNGIHLKKISARFFGNTKNVRISSRGHFLEKGYGDGFDIGSVNNYEASKGLYRFNRRKIRTIGWI